MSNGLEPFLRVFGAIFAFSCVVSACKGGPRTDKTAPQDPCGGEGKDRSACLRAAQSIEASDTAKAAILFEKACNLGSAVACRRAGEILSLGLNVTEAHAKRIEALFERACSNNELEACVELAKRLSEPENGSPAPRARQLLERACDGGVTKGCTGLGALLSLEPSTANAAVGPLRRGCDGKDAMACGLLGLLLSDPFLSPASENKTPSKEADLSTVASLLEQGCNANLNRACSQLGALYATGKVGRGEASDDVHARRLLTRGCDGDDPESCYRLGIMYESGKGGPADIDRAAEVYRKSCAAKYVKGCTGIGVLIFDGKVQPKPDESRPDELFNLACDGGDSHGCAALGAMYANGSGPIKRDPKRATELFSKSCATGDPRGCYGLGVSYLTSKNGQERRAATPLKKACDEHLFPACTALGMMYAIGTGLSSDLEKAKKLFGEACAGGDKQGCDGQAKLQADLRGGWPP